MGVNAPSTNIQAPKKHRALDITRDAAADVPKARLPAGEPNVGLPSRQSCLRYDFAD
jgi:hypothetical protein